METWRKCQLGVWDAGVVFVESKEASICGSLACLVCLLMQTDCLKVAWDEGAMLIAQTGQTCTNFPQLPSFSFTPPPPSSPTPPPRGTADAEINVSSAENSEVPCHNIESDMDSFYGAIDHLAEGYVERRGARRSSLKGRERVVFTIRTLEVFQKQRWKTSERRDGAHNYGLAMDTIFN